MGNYPNDLAEWLSERRGNKSTHATTLASFLAVSENVRDAIDAGFELKTIWEHLRERKRISFRLGLTQSLWKQTDCAAPVANN